MGFAQCIDGIGVRHGRNQSVDGFRIMTLEQRSRCVQLHGGVRVAQCRNQFGRNGEIRESGERKRGGLAHSVIGVLEQPAEG